MTRRDPTANGPASVLASAAGARATTAILAGSLTNSRRRFGSSSARLRALGVICFAASWLWCAASPAQDNYREQMKGLDEQVQEIKSDVLSIAQELNRLEEKLLYPSNTQLALFVALTGGEAVRLDAVRIQIDGQPVAHYIYSHKELEALQKGGVQRIYTGNVGTGAHQLEVSVIGKLAGGKDYSESGRFTISKGIEPKLVGITLAGPGTAKAAIEIGDW